MVDLTKEDLIKEYQNKIRLQDYSKQETIEGVKLVEIKNFVGEDGDFSELLRLDENAKSQEFPDFQVRQINRSKMMSNTVKAWHLHFKQDEIQNVLPSDRLLIGLLDLRANSPTAGLTMRIVMGEGKSHLLYIPKGVAHGYANWTNSPATILYFIDHQFDIKNPDEFRIPWETMGEDFWKPVRD